MQKITPFLWINDNAEEAMNAMLKMKKIIIADLEKAVEGVA